MTAPIDLEALREVRDYFDQRQDAEYHTDSACPTPNEEMKLGATVDLVMRQVVELTAELTTRRARDAEVAALVEAVGMASDTLDNLIHAMAMPFPDELHMKALRVALPDLLKEMRAALRPFHPSGSEGESK